MPVCRCRRGGFGDDVRNGARGSVYNYSSLVRVRLQRAARCTTMSDPAQILGRPTSTLSEPESLDVMQLRRLDSRSSGFRPPPPPPESSPQTVASVLSGRSSCRNRCSARRSVGGRGVDCLQR